MSYSSRDRDDIPDSPSAGRIFGGIITAVTVLVVFALGINFLTSLKSTAPGEICVVQEGGPFDGRDVADIRQPGQGVSSIGIFNDQRCFPSTERNYIVSKNPDESDSGTVDKVRVPTLDSVNVWPEGQALFRLSTDPKVLREFYRKYGVRTFDGKHPYDDGGWQTFLKVSVRPVLENALREAIGGFRCTALNATCQYVVNAEKAVKGEVNEVDSSQNLTAVQDKIAATLEADLATTLGGKFFEGVRFRLRGISFDDKVEAEVLEAQAKRTSVATATLEASRAVEQAKGEAQSKVEAAKGEAQSAEERAKAIRATNQAYKDNPSQAAIDKIKALCGPGGCNNLSVLGGNASTIVGRP